MTSMNGCKVDAAHLEVKVKHETICIDLTEDDNGLPVKKFVTSVDLSCQQPGTSKSASASTSAKTPIKSEPQARHCVQTCSKCKQQVLSRTLDCSHSLCYGCLVRTLKRNLHTIDYCPIEDCKRPISDRAIKRSLTVNDYIAFLEHSRNNYRRAVGELPAIIKEVIDISEEPTGFADLQKIYEKKYVQNFERFDCPICFVEVPIQGGVILKSCFHQFCQDCIIETVRNSPSAEVFCPFDNQEHQSCNFTILDSELRAIVPMDVLEKHLEKSLKQGENVLANVFHCKSPNCDGFVVKENDTIAFVCPVCEVVNCVKCSAIHEEKSCEQHLEHLKLDSVNQRDLKLTSEAVEKLLEKGDVRYFTSLKGFN